MRQQWAMECADRLQEYWRHWREHIRLKVRKNRARDGVRKCSLRLKDYELRLKVSRLRYNFVGPKTLQTQIRRIAAEFCCSRAGRVSCLRRTGLYVARKNAMCYACELNLMHLARAQGFTDPTTLDDIEQLLSYMPAVTENIPHR